ncbi:hypothetical protein KO507_00720 [Gilvimarinus agarilyticus]|uniref:hypothetical protein n=1 Tax=Gilvimarinus sp. 2_MG-2023 TaxID=3062666 RepID=UPI001C096383|nr:hypothetical protein [Gilvimarinus sp. 2_MG-2023]MBU2884280.1 hypothetical protein [Gilvimarinus agarilyticus]MDO6569418.1 hypothetical protein [Gilvimarinus sp. 2_MG-2023]
MLALLSLSARSFIAWSLYACRLRQPAAVVLLCIIIIPAWAANPTVELAPGLLLAPPDSLIISTIQHPDTSDSTVLAGYLSNQPSYFISASMISGWKRNHMLWRILERKLKHRSLSNTISVLDRAQFFTNQDAQVWYRVYEFSENKVNQRVGFYLLKHNNAIYWITLSIVDSAKIEVVLPIVETIIKRAQVKPLLFDVNQ